jgi:nitrate reductase NapAB chaperone NapD
LAGPYHIGVLLKLTGYLSGPNEFNSDKRMENNSNLFNLSFLEETSEGDTGFVIQMVSLILDEAPERLKSLGEAIQNRDFAIIKTSAHRLKNLVIPVQMERAKDLATSIEECSYNAENLQLIVSYYAELKEIINAVLEPLRERIEVLKQN